MAAVFKISGKLSIERSLILSTVLHFLEGTCAYIYTADKSSEHSECNDSIKGCKMTKGRVCEDLFMC